MREWCQEEDFEPCQYFRNQAIWFTYNPKLRGLWKKGTSASTRSHGRVQRWGPDESPITLWMRPAISSALRQASYIHKTFAPHSNSITLPLQVRNLGLGRLSNFIAQAHTQLTSGRGEFCIPVCPAPKHRLLTTALDSLPPPGLLLEIPLEKEKRPGGARFCKIPEWGERIMSSSSSQASMALGPAETRLRHS